jgi:prepilin-type N-terminal cleavage/methylation domain-containing protein
MSHSKTDRRVAFGRRDARRGFTLLELLLAVGLSSMLLVTLGGAIHTFVTSTDQSRTRIEEIKLVRQILAMISRDLQNVVLDQPQDLADRIPRSEAAQTNPTEPVLDENGDPIEGESPEEDPAEEPMEDPDDEMTDTEPAFPSPGLVGTQYELQVEVGRAPRYDEVEYHVAATARREDPPKMDFATIIYRIRTGVVYNPLDRRPLSQMDEEVGGLVRLQMDRIAAKLALDWGEQGYANEKLLAPEVVQLEFSYFDGTQWLTEWDSETDGALPVAVEVTIGLIPIRDGLSRTKAKEFEGTTVEQAAEDPDLSAYRETIFLRGASTRVEATTTAVAEAAEAPATPEED